MSKKKNHEGAHQLERLKTLKGSFIYRCMIPGCPSYFGSPELALGQMSQCPNCSSEFPLTRDNLKLKKLLCDSCRKARAQARGKSYAEIMEENL